MRVEELMSEAKCCRETDTAMAAAKMMREEAIGFVPICDRSGKPVGACTDRDLTIRILAEGRPGDTKLSDCMSKDVISCRTGSVAG